MRKLTPVDDAIEVRGANGPSPSDRCQAEMSSKRLARIPTKS